MLKWFKIRFRQLGKFTTNIWRDIANYVDVRVVNGRRIMLNVRCDKDHHTVGVTVIHHYIVFLSLYPRSWWFHQMETFPLKWPVVSPPPPATHHTQRPVTRSFDTFFDVRLNKPLTIHSWGWWVEMPSCSLWRYCNERGTQVCIMVVERQPMIKRGYGFALFVHIALTTKITEYCTPYFKMLRMKPHHAHMTHNDN